MATAPNWAAVDRAKLALADHQSRYGLEGDRSTILFHMLADFVELCDSDGIDLDATLGEVRQYFAENEEPYFPDRSDAVKQAEFRRNR